MDRLQLGHTRRIWHKNFLGIFSAATSSIFSIFYFFVKQSSLEKQKLSTSHPMPNVQSIFVLTMISMHSSSLKFTVNSLSVVTASTKQLKTLLNECESLVISWKWVANKVNARISEAICRKGEYDWDFKELV